MNRRDSLFALLVLAVVTGPVLSSAQRPARVWRVGFLVARRRPDCIESDMLGGFPRGMRELGYVEGRDFIIEWRFADGSAERPRALATELVQLKVDADCLRLIARYPCAATGDYHRP